MIVSSSLLVFSKEPVTGDVYFMLGEECAVTLEHTRIRERWAEFCGRREDGESCEMAAAREFVEETACCLRFGLERGAETADSICHALQSGMYTSQIIVQPGDGWHRPKRAGDLSPLLRDPQPLATPNRLRVCYLRQVPWQPESVLEFERTRASLLAGRLLNHPAWRGGRSEPNPVYLEKLRLRYWSVPSLLHVLQNSGRFGQERFRLSFVNLMRIVLPMFMATDPPPLIQSHFTAHDSGKLSRPPWKSSIRKSRKMSGCWRHWRPSNARSSESGSEKPARSTTLSTANPSQ